VVVSSSEAALSRLRSFSSSDDDELDSDDDEDEDSGGGTDLVFLDDLAIRMVQFVIFIGRNTEMIGVVVFGQTFHVAYSHKSHTYPSLSKQEINITHQIFGPASINETQKCFPCFFAFWPLAESPLFATHQPDTPM